MGQPITGSFTLLSNSEVSATTDASTGAVLAAPTGPVFDPVVGFQYVLVGQAVIGSALESFSINATSVSAVLEFGLGNSAAR